MSDDKMLRGALGFPLFVHQPDVTDEMLEKWRTAPSQYPKLGGDCDWELSAPARLADAQAGLDALAVAWGLG